MKSEHRNYQLEKMEDSAVSVLLKLGISDQIVENALKAAQKIINEAGLSEKFYVGSVEVSEIPTEVVAEATERGCGYRRVCDRSEHVCDWYIDAQGNSWRRCYTKPICRMVPRIRS